MKIKNILTLLMALAMTLYSVNEPLDGRTLLQLSLCYLLALALFFFIHRNVTFPMAKQIINVVLSHLNIHLRRIHRVFKNLDRLRIFPFSLSSLIKLDEQGNCFSMLDTGMEIRKYAEAPMQESIRERKTYLEREVKEYLHRLKSKGHTDLIQYKQALELLGQLKDFQEKGDARRKVVDKIQENFGQYFYQVPISESLVKEIIWQGPMVDFQSKTPFMVQFYDYMRRKILVRILAAELGEGATRARQGSWPVNSLIRNLADSLSTSPEKVMEIIWAMLVIEEGKVTDNEFWEDFILKIYKHKNTGSGLLSVLHYFQQKEAALPEMLERHFFPEKKTSHKLFLSNTLERYLHLLHEIERDDRDEFEAGSSEKRLNGCYKLLQCHPHNSESTLKKKFNKLALRYHPDRVSTQSQEDYQKMNDFFVEIQDAYRLIRGVKVKIRKARQALNQIS